MKFENKVNLTHTNKFHSDPLNEYSKLPTDDTCYKFNDEKEDLVKQTSKGLVWTLLSSLYYLLYIFLSVGGILVYNITLEGCPDSDGVCVEKYTMAMLMTAIKLIALSGFLFSLQIYLIIVALPQKILGISVNAMIVVYLTFFFDTGSDFLHHGAYNRLILFLSMFFYALIFVYIHNLIFRSNFVRLIMLFITVLISVSTYIYMKNKIDYWVKYSCDDWYLGLKGSKLDNTDNDCVLYKPDICYFRLFYGTLDISRITGTSCSVKRSDDFSKNNIYLKDDIKNAKIIGFPRTEQWPRMPDLYWKSVQQNVLNRLIDMEKADPKVKENIESVINLKVDPPRLEINLKKNEQLIKERDKIFSKNKDQVLAKNVFYLFLDSLSRVEFRRKLPKFYKWIENKYHFDQNEGKKNSHEAFQFFRYHGVGAYTEQNMIPSIFGSYNYDKGGIHFLKYYLEKGYIAGQAINYCGSEIFSVDEGKQEEMEWARFDHEFFAPFCDMNFSTKDNSYSILQGTNSIHLRCLYSKLLIEHSMDYTLQFFEAYKNQPKIFRLATYEAHEGSGEAIKYEDDVLANFFANFEKAGHLKDTILYIHSDHGLAMLGPYSAMNLDDYWQELILPNFFLILPTDMPNYDQIRSNLKMTEQALITPFCVYRSLIAILNDKSIVKDNNNYPPIDNDFYDLFNAPVPISRDCNAFINKEYPDYYDNFCRCEKLS